MRFLSGTSLPSLFFSCLFGENFLAGIHPKLNGSKTAMFPFLATLGDSILPERRGKKRPQDEFVKNFGPICPDAVFSSRAHGQEWASLGKKIGGRGRRSQIQSVSFSCPSRVQHLSKIVAGLELPGSVFSSLSLSPRTFCSRDDFYYLPRREREREKEAKWYF